MADRPEMFGPNRGFSGIFGDGRFSGTMQNVGRPLLPWQRNLG